MKPLLCVFHAHCDDGFGAAWAVRHALPDTEFYAGVHGGKVPWNLIRGRDVLFVDFCYPSHIMNDVMAVAMSVTVLDHHRSTMDDMLGWAKAHGYLIVTNPNGMVVIQNNGNISRKVSMFFDMKRSGAMMAWDHYHPDQPAPRFIDYIQGHDLWTKKLPGIDEFTAALRSYPMDFEVWDGFEVWKTFEQLLVDGAHILRYKRQLVDQAVKNSFWVEIDVPTIYRVPNAGATDGLNVPDAVKNAKDVPVNIPETIRLRGANVIPAISSEVGEELALRYGGQSLTWVEGVKLWNYQLRSRAGGDQPAPDVSKIAVSFGGGGHAQAAGFKTEHRVHRKWVAPHPDED